MSIMMPPAEYICIPIILIFVSNSLPFNAFVLSGPYLLYSRWLTFEADFVIFGCCVVVLNLLIKLDSCKLIHRSLQISPRTMQRTPSLLDLQVLLLCPYESLIPRYDRRLMWRVLRLHFLPDLSPSSVESAAAPSQLREFYLLLLQLPSSSHLPVSSFRLQVSSLLRVFWPPALLLCSEYAGN